MYELEELLVNDSKDLFKVDLDTISTNNKAQILRTSYIELRLLNIYLQASITQPLQYYYNMKFILCFVIEVNKDIV